MGILFPKPIVLGGAYVLSSDYPASALRAGVCRLPQRRSCPGTLTGCPGPVGPGGGGFCPLSGADPAAGFLLEGEDWQSPEEIDKVYLTQWYLRRWILTQGDGGEFLVTPLLSANEDGLFFPEGELEAAVEEAFGLSPEWLREDNLTYRPEEAGYRTAGAAGDLRRYEIDLLTAQEEDGVLTLTFTLESDAGLPRQTKELTVLTDGDAPRYRSLVTLP